MRGTVCAALMMLTITTASAAEKDTTSASYLLPFCKLTKEQAESTPRNALNAGRCMGTVEGVGQTFRLLNEGAGGRVGSARPAAVYVYPAGHHHPAACRRRGGVWRDFSGTDTPAVHGACDVCNSGGMAVQELSAAPRLHNAE
jgi:hypothetical protein